MKATFIKTLDNFSGHAALYKVKPPVSYGYEEPEQTEYVIVSAVDNYLAHETYIFPACADGRLMDWCELDDSLKDTTSHEEALNAAGYTLVDDKGGAPGTSGYFSMRD